MPRKKRSDPKNTAPALTTMPSDGIISALKQGNALELEFVKRLKEGLETIADGMQTECYKRGDALEDLRESLEVHTMKLFECVQS
jgi:hypothetical protein